MRKYVFVTVSCCLFAGGLCADPVDFTITGLTAREMGGGPFVTFSGSGSSASGDSISIGGSYGTMRLGSGVSPGEPLGQSFDLYCTGMFGLACNEGGVATIGGKEFSVQLLAPGGIPVSATTSVRFQPPTLEYTVSATAAGEFTAVCSIGSVNCVPGTLIANVFIDLVGGVTIDILQPVPGEYFFGSATFVPAPEPSATALLLVGSGILLRLRRIRCGNTFSW